MITPLVTSGFLRYLLHVPYGTVELCVYTNVHLYTTDIFTDGKMVYVYDAC